MKRLYLSIPLIFLLLVHGYGQDIASLGSKKPFEIHGSVGGGMNFFASNEDYATRDPFAWNTHASLTLSIYGIAVPLSFSMTQFSKSYSTPFSRFGMSPTYKWAKLHLGYRTLSFSPFVFDGQSFLGTGIELHPHNFYFAAFYGRLNSAISEDTTADRRIEPRYGRHGYGFKVGLKNEKKELTLEYLRAYDDVASIQRYEGSTYSLAPQSNNVVGTTWRFKLFDKLDFRGNFAASLWNQDLHYAVLDSIGDTKIASFVKEVAPLTYSSVFNWSGQAQMGMNLKQLNASVGYRRVQPDFKSLGVPYMLDDVEMINANVGSSLLQGKLSLNADFNTQRNNLNKMLSSKLVSSTGTLSANAFINSHFTVTAMATGAEVFQKDGLLELTEDTRMNQFMFTFMLSPLLNFTDGDRHHSLSNNVSYTRLNDKNPTTSPFTNGRNLNLSSQYALQFMQKFMGLSGGVQYSSYQQKESSYSSLSLNAGANAQLLESRALSVQGNTGYMINKASESATGNNITFSLNSSYRLQKNCSFGMHMSYIITPPVNLDPLDKVRIDRIPYAVNSRIFSGGVSFNYSF